MPSIPDEVGLNNRAPADMKKHRSECLLFRSRREAVPAVHSSWPMALSTGPASGNAAFSTQPLETTCPWKPLGMLTRDGMSQRAP